MSPDPFGIGLAIEHGLRMLLHGQRHSGRTEVMLEQIKEGDLIVVTMWPIRQHLLRRLRELNFKDVEVVIIDPRSLGGILERTAFNGGKRRVVLDHSVYEAYYSYAMDYAIRDMERFREHLDKRYESHKSEKTIEGRKDYV